MIFRYATTHRVFLRNPHSRLRQHSCLLHRPNNHICARKQIAFHILFVILPHYSFTRRNNGITQGKNGKRTFLGSTQQWRHPTVGHALRHSARPPAHPRRLQHDDHDRRILADCRHPAEQRFHGSAGESEKSYPRGLQLRVLVQHLCRTLPLYSFVFLRSAHRRLLPLSRAVMVLPLCLSGLSFCQHRHSPRRMAAKEPASEGTGKGQHRSRGCFQLCRRDDGLDGICLLGPGHAEHRLYPHGSPAALALFCP